MSASGMVRHGDTSIQWDENRSEMTIDFPSITSYNRAIITYDQARDLLDCLMVIFGRMELVRRYPEVR